MTYNLIKSKANTDFNGGNIGSEVFISTGANIVQNNPYKSRYVVEVTLLGGISFTLGNISSTEIQNGYFVMIYNASSSLGNLTINNFASTQVCIITPGESVILTCDTNLANSWQALVGSTSSNGLTARTAYVDLNGNDSTGLVESPDNPFLTAQAAINAISLIKVAGDIWTVILGCGNFGNVTLPEEININGIGPSSVISTITSGATSTGKGSVINNCRIVGNSISLNMITNFNLIISNCVIEATSFVSLQYAFNISNGNVLLDGNICYFDSTYNVGEVYYFNTSGSNSINL